MNTEKIKEALACLKIMAMVRDVDTRLTNLADEALEQLETLESENATLLKMTWDNKPKETN